MTAPVRMILILVAGAVALALVGAVAERRKPPAGMLVTENGDTVAVTDDARAAGLAFAAAVPAVDRAWIVAALTRARPEAARLLAEVDGMVTLGRLPAASDNVLGVTRGDARGFTVDLDLTRLDGDSALDRATVVLHEFGHVIDFALVPAALGTALDAQIPRGGPCGLASGCDAPPERFADTFAKWALNGAVSQAGAGYGVPMPASIETWGAPLGALAARLPSPSR